MTNPSYCLLLLTLLMDGGTPPPPSGGARADAGIVSPSASATKPDGGASSRAPIIAEGIEWPDDLRPLATLDGPALMAAHAALQKLLSSFPTEYASDCSYSAKAMEVAVAQHGGLYFVEITRRLGIPPFAGGPFTVAILVD
ncbi:hypothetical protein OV208_18235 [Corallococcus sp. bb12-1]|uniref:hypothetical protein n=1 Tax=Corallococcus sp. bb12-1 TaxID=2996784 RepID=UPI00226D9EF4|nr:hypothetical protein [Corallococcus sp. bb12-1]MCY1043262.1 hypothetical protein [Corallococcus sp. bb12-1]